MAAIFAVKDEKDEPFFRTSFYIHLFLRWLYGKTFLPFRTLE